MALRITWRIQSGERPGDRQNHFQTNVVCQPPRPAYRIEARRIAAKRHQSHTPGQATEMLHEALCHQLEEVLSSGHFGSADNGYPARLVRHLDGLHRDGGLLIHPQQQAIVIHHGEHPVAAGLRRHVPDLDVDVHRARQPARVDSAAAAKDGAPRDARPDRQRRSSRALSR
ncbi:hypothetical protein ACGFIE_30480 [Micromonospora sp. NPDC049275]|uniref:hypothetical protein n=1 Tax=Micromonospora sp. NPDC049275 TaxID=3364268 RepID=UPI00371DA0D1